MKEDFSFFIMFISFLGMIFLFRGCTGCMGCDSHRPVSTSSYDNDYLRYRLDHDAVKRVLNYNDNEAFLFRYQYVFLRLVKQGKSAEWYRKRLEKYPHTVAQSRYLNIVAEAAHF